MTARRTLILVAVVGLVLAAGWAARPEAVTATQRVQRIAAELRCPVCQGLSAQDSPSETAREMRDLVALRVTEGRSDDEIRAEFRRSYGDWVFLAPPLGGPSGLVWLLPVLLVIVGGGIAFARVRRSGPDQQSADPLATVDPVDPGALRRLRERVIAEETFDK